MHLNWPGATKLTSRSSKQHILQELTHFSLQKVVEMDLKQGYSARMQ